MDPMRGRQGEPPWPAAGGRAARFAGAGQAVRKGEVLAYAAPTAGAIERSNQLAQQAELRAAQGLARQRVARLQALADTVARKDIEAAEAELHSLTQRLAAVGAGLQQRDALVAPASGVIASANAVAGQVVDARELAFEVVDPRHLRIEALAYPPGAAQDIASAYLALGGRRCPWRFVGRPAACARGTAPVVHGRCAGPGAPALGQPACARGRRTRTRSRHGGAGGRAAAQCRTRASSGSRPRPSALSHA